MNIIGNHIDGVKKLCTAHNVDTMYLYGSALRADFSADSDIDFLVKFKPIDLAAYFDNYINFKEKLKTLLGRDVDLLEEQTLKNPILINSISKSKKLIYNHTLHYNNEKIFLPPEQLEMLTMSEDDILNGRLISEEDLDKLDTENLLKEV